MAFSLIQFQWWSEIKMRLANKVALITGGGTGIGRATAELFAQEGAKVAISGRRVEKLNEVVSHITSNGGEAIAVPGDVTNEIDVKSMVSQPITRWNRLDILICNAAVIDRAQTHESTLNNWDHVMNVNVRGVFLISKHVIPEMIRFGGGSIVIISSVSGLLGQSDAHSYSTSKGAILSLARSQASSYGSDNIRVNAICPALVETPMPHSRLKEGESWDERVTEWAKDYPLGRIGQPMDIAYGCLYLASDEAAWVSGTTLVIDGGRSTR